MVLAQDDTTSAALISLPFGTAPGLDVNSLIGVIGFIHE